MSFWWQKQELDEKGEKRKKERKWPSRETIHTLGCQIDTGRSGVSVRENRNSGNVRGRNEGWKVSSEWFWLSIYEQCIDSHVYLSPKVLSFPASVILLSTSQVLNQHHSLMVPVFVRSPSSSFLSSFPSLQLLRENESTSSPEVKFCFCLSTILTSFQWERKGTKVGEKGRWAREGSEENGPTVGLCGKGCSREWTWNSRSLGNVGRRRMSDSWKKSKCHFPLSLPPLHPTILSRPFHSHLPQTFDTLTEHTETL